MATLVGKEKLKATVSISETQDHFSKSVRTRAILYYLSTSSSTRAGAYLPRRGKLRVVEIQALRDRFNKGEKDTSLLRHRNV